MLLQLRIFAQLQLLLLLLLPLSQQLVVAQSVQVNCFPELRQNSDPGRQACAMRRCQYMENRIHESSPFCVWNRAGYSLQQQQQISTAQWRAQLVKDFDHSGPFPSSPDVAQLQLTVTEISDHAARISLTDSQNTRYSVPAAALSIPEPGPSNSGPNFEWAASSDDTYARLWAKGTNTSLVALQRAGLIYSDQFIQVALQLGCSRIYGLGEHNHRQLLHDRTYRRWTMWTRDASPLGPENLYSSQPYFICGDSGSYIGIFMKASNALEIELTPEGVIYRQLGGVPDLYIFFGDSPESVTRHYSAAIGHPLMPPYWSLGFQLCRWGYENISVVREVVRRNRAIGLPYDVQYGDIDYMQNTMDFTIDKENYVGLDELVDDLHAYGQKYFVILDPAISSDRRLHQQVLQSGRYAPYEDGLVKGVFSRNPDGSVHEGEVWPGRTVFPDFSLPATQQWWEHWVRDFYYNQGIKVDGLWIDMNEPASFTYEPHKNNNCSYNKWNYPPYLPTSFLGSRLYEKTICMDTVENWGKHYDTHSLYGHAMAMQSYTTLRNMFPSKRPIVFSRSTFAGTGRYAQHWLGDNFSRWSNLHWSIVAMLEFGLFGFPYTGADICGFVFDAEQQMCIRWQQLGAFYPFSRNHNVKIADGRKTIDQDPAFWDEEAQVIIKRALLFRYTYLPYLYTLFHYAHTEGATVVRSLNHEFPHDPNTAGIDRQFMWGSSMLITPVLEPDVDHVTGYFPGIGWYDAHNGSELHQAGNVNLQAPLQHINVHFRKGSILPWQEPSVNTVRSRKKPLGLVVAVQRSGLNPIRYSATGSLFWDDGDSFETYQSGNYILYNFDFGSDETGMQHNLNLRVAHAGYEDPNSLKFEKVTFHGLAVEGANLQVMVNNTAHTNFTYDHQEGRLELLRLGMSLGSSHTISMVETQAASIATASAVTSLIALVAFLISSVE